MPGDDEFDLPDLPPLQATAATSVPDESLAPAAAADGPDDDAELVLGAALTFEATVVGELLLAEPSEARSVFSVLMDTDFTCPGPRAIFECARDVLERDGTLDAVLVREELRTRNGHTPKTASEDLLLAMSSAVSVANLRLHAQVLARRQALLRVNRAARALADSETDQLRQRSRLLLKDAETRLEQIDRWSDPASDAPLPPSAAAEPVRDRPLPFGQYDLDPFPIDALPRPLADWSVHVAVSLQVPLDLPAMLALTVLSTSCAGKYEAKIRGSWREVLGLYTLTTAEPGSRKSAAFSLATAVLYDFQKERQDAEFYDLRRARDQYESAEQRVEQTKKRLADAKSSADQIAAKADYETALANFRNTPAAKKPLEILGDDVTPEKLAIMLQEQQGRFALLSPEGGLLRTVTGTRYSKTGAPSFDVLLKAHAGDTISVARKGSDPVFVRRPVLSVGLAVQPEILRELASEPSARGVGLLARFLYAVPPTTVGARQIRPGDIPPDIDAAYRSFLRSLLDIPLPPEPTLLPFNPAADDLLALFETELEPRLGPDGDLHPIADWASKLAGAVARMAALFAIGDGAGFEYSAPECVERGHVERAIQIARYLIPHATAAFDAAIETEETRVAKRILAWAERNRVTEFSINDAFHATKGPNSRVQRSDDVRPAIDVLLDRRLITEKKATPTPQGKSGRKPSPRYVVEELRGTKGTVPEEMRNRPKVSSEEYNNS